MKGDLGPYVKSRGYPNITKSWSGLHWGAKIVATSHDCSPFSSGANGCAAEEDTGRHWKCCRIFGDLAQRRAKVLEHARKTYIMLRQKDLPSVSGPLLQGGGVVAARQG